MADLPVQETELIERAIAGDADAFGALYDCYLDAIYRYICLRVGDVHDAEDLTEQVFLRAWEALPAYEDYGNRFLGWLYRIAHNAVVDHHRRHAAHTALPEESLDLASSQPAALDQILKAEEAEALAEAIAQLPEDRQRIILLRFVDGLKHAKIARILNISEGASRALQHRSLAALARLLSGKERGRRD